MAGPGQMPDMPQPMPNSAAPATSGVSILVNSGSWNWVSKAGAVRPRPTADGNEHDDDAGDHHEARLGSQPPVGMAVKSRSAAL